MAGEPLKIEAKKVVKFWAGKWKKIKKNIG